MRPLLATYRLQLRAGMRLRDARRLVPYLERLGVSHLYLSPILCARTGSTHGYDVTDPQRLDPALGSEADLRSLAAALHAAGMGLLLDIVPNHMAADPEAPAFADVLRRGRDSPFAPMFDIDWDAPTPLRLPVLGAPLGRELAAGRLVRRGDCVVYAGRRYPLSPSTLAGSDASLGSLLRRQPYRLAYWRSARRRLAYRRFFDVNELIGLRQEDEAVFRYTHRTLLAWVRAGLVDGLRIDHVDGLLAPGRYLARLRRAVGDRVPLLVEKILAPGERLPSRWPVEGTTGYEFIPEVEGLLHDVGGVRRLEGIWRRFTGQRRGWEDTAVACKRRVLRSLLEADLRRVVRAGLGPAAGARALTTLETGLVELIAQLPVYRTYLQRGARPRDVDRRRLRGALERASRHAERRSLQPLRELLEPIAWPFVEKLQQLSGPCAAKGIEDTALYVHVPLLSRNEVGGHPAPLPDGVGRFHQAARERQRRWARSLLATTTHDTKRSADVRARLAVLSELPDAWAEALRSWAAANRRHKRRVAGRLLPDRNTESLLYQTLVGVWPLERGAGASHAALRARVEAYMVKAAREAKRHTSWLDPNGTFESALLGFVRAALRDRRFVGELTAFVERIARPGLWNALSRTLLQLTAPGVPDVYQGDELWSFALVDPDNRRPVDFERRRRLLRAVERGFAAPPASRLRFLERLVREPEDGRLKLHVVRATLGLRRTQPRLFADGSYHALRARGGRRRHVVAFARRSGTRELRVLAPRLPLTLVGDSARAPVGAEVWGGTRLPVAGAGESWRCVLSGRTLRTRSEPGAGASLALADAFAVLPVALLVRG